MSEVNWYRAGQVTLTNGSENVTGTGTEFVTAGVHAGEILIVEANGERQILEVITADSETQIRIAQPWAHATEGPLDYFIIKSITGTHNHQVIEHLSNLLSLRSMSHREMVQWADGDLVGVPINNMLTNGDFTSGLSGWTENGASGITYDTSNNRLEMARNGAASDPSVYQIASLVSGRQYVIAFEVFHGSTERITVKADNQVLVPSEDVRIGLYSIPFNAPDGSVTIRITSEGGAESKLNIGNIKVGDPSDGLYPFLDSDSGEFIWVPSPAKIAEDINAGVLTAYESWLNQGNTGSEADFLESLKGEQGDASTMTVGTVTTVAYGEGASVSNTGTPQNAVLNFQIEGGPAATVQIGDVETTTPGSEAAVVNSGTGTNAILDFVLPAGLDGQGLPRYGLPGQVLAKSTAEDFDYHWVYPGVVGDWSELTNTPTTLEGYGITDSYTMDELVTILSGFTEVGHTHMGSDIIGLDAYSRFEIDTMLSSISSKTEVKVNQVGHGFAVLDCIRHSGASWLHAQANDLDKTSYGVVVAVEDDDNFTFAITGRYDVGVHGLTVGQWYYLSEDTPGGISEDRSTIVEQPVLYVESMTAVVVYAYRPSDILDPNSITHGDLSGLLDDTHPQYLNSNRGDARYYLKAEVDLAITGVNQTITDGLATKADASHTHLEADLTIDKYTQAEVDAALALKAESAHTHTESDITDLDKYTQAEADAAIAAAVAPKADTTALDAKADASHTHTIADITDLSSAGIPEAPNDGGQYVRQNEDWAEVDLSGVGGAGGGGAGTPAVTTQIGPMLSRKPVPTSIVDGEVVIDLSGVQSGRKLILEGRAQSAKAVNYHWAFLEVNGVASSSAYHGQRINGDDGGSAGSFEYTNASIFHIPGTSAPSNEFVNFKIEIPNFSEDTLTPKFSTCQFWLKYSASASEISIMGSTSPVTDPITSLKIKTDTGEDIAGDFFCYVEEEETIEVLTAADSGVSVVTEIDLPVVHSIRVENDGTILWSSEDGWSVTEESTGVYSVTFPTAAESAEEQSLVVSHVDDGTNLTGLMAQIENVTATGCKVITHRNDSNADISVSWSLVRRLPSETVEIAAGGGGDVEEAPQDGKQYARSDGAWELIDINIDAGSVDGGIEAHIDKPSFVTLDGVLDEATATITVPGKPESEPEPIYPLEIDPHFGSVSSLIHFDGQENGSAPIDQIPGVTWTANGGASVQSGSSLYGDGGLYVDGVNGSCLESSGIPAIGSDDFCIELSLKITDTGDYQTVFDSREESTNGFYIVCSILPTSGYATFYVNSADRIVGSITLFDGEWHHLAISRSNGVTKMFIDGQQDGADYVDSNDYLLGSNGYVVGANGFASGRPYAVFGSIDEFRLTIGAGRYADSFTSITESHPDSRFASGREPTILDPHWAKIITRATFDGAHGATTVTDEGPLGLTLNCENETHVSTDQFKFGTASAEFDGNNDYLGWDGTEIAALDLNQDFTIEFWAYIGAAGASLACLLHVHDGSSNNGLNIYRDAATGVLNIDNGTVAAPSNGSTVIPLNEWHHVAAVRSGGTIYGFLDGNLEFSYAAQSYPSTLQAGAFGLFRDANHDLTGFIDDARITQYARYTESFTAPTAALPVMEYDPEEDLTPEPLELVPQELDALFDDVIALYPFDGGDSASITDASGNDLLELYGTPIPATSTADKQFGDSSLNFPTGSWAELHTNFSSGSTWTDKGARDCTIEGWFTFKNVAGYLWQQGASGSGSSTGEDSNRRNGLAAVRNTDGSVVFYGGNLGTYGWGSYFAMSTAAGAVPHSQRVHIAFVIKDQVPYFFVDGVNQPLSLANGSTSQNTFANINIWTEAPLCFNAKYYEHGTRMIGIKSGYPTVVNDLDYIDDLRFTNEARYLEDFTPPTEANPTSRFLEGYEATIIDPDFKYVKSLCHFEGADGDVSHDDEVDTVEWVYGGGATLSDTWSAFGDTSLKLTAATGDYVRTPDIPDFGTEDFTFECFFKGANIGGAYSVLFSTYGANDNSSGMQLVIRESAAGHYVYLAAQGSIVISGTTNIRDDVARHISLCRKDGVTRLFIDGTQEGVDYADSNDYVTGDNDFVLGANSYTLGTDSLQGHLDEVRIAIGLGRYGSDFTVPTEAFPSFEYDPNEDLTPEPEPTYVPTTPVEADPDYGTVSLLLDFEEASGDVVDKGPLGLAPTEQTTATSDAESKFGSRSLYSASNSAGKITYAPNEAFNLATGDFTVEFWVYPTSFSDGVRILAHSGASGSVFPAWDIRSNSSGEIIPLFGSGTTSSSGFGDTNVGVQMTLNQWQHYAWVREGSTDYFYLDGLLIGSAAAKAIGNGEFEFVINGDMTSGNYAQPGHLDGLRITKGLARYTDEFTPPANAHPTSRFEPGKEPTILDPYFSDVVSLLHFEAGFGPTTIEDAVGDITWTAAGSVYIDDTQKAFGETSARFNGGSTDRVDGDAPVLPATGDFTLEGFVRFASLAAEDTYGKAILSQYSAGTSGRSVFGLYNNKLSAFVDGVNANQWVEGSTVLSANTDYHFAIVRDGDHIRGYIDGFEEFSYDTGGASIEQSNAMLGAYLSGGTYYGKINGWLDELRTTEAARYTEDFTIPAEAYPDFEYDPEENLDGRLPWEPSGVGANLWIDATDDSTVNLNGTLVESWYDKSGNSNHLSQSNASYQPTFEDAVQNGKPGILFDGSNDYLAFLTPSDLKAASEKTIFYVYKASGTGDYNFALSSRINHGGVNTIGDGYILLDVDGENKYSHTGRGGDYSTVETPVDTLRIGAVSTEANGGDIWHYADGVEYPSTTDTLQSPYAEATGGYSALMSQGGAIAGGHVFEVIALPEIVSTEKRQIIEGYLAHKWGMTLPENHPYEYAAPWIEDPEWEEPVDPVEEDRSGLYEFTVSEVTGTNVTPGEITMHEDGKSATTGIASNMVADFAEIEYVLAVVINEAGNTVDVVVTQKFQRISSSEVVYTTKIEAGSLSDNVEVWAGGSKLLSINADGTLIAHGDLRVEGDIDVTGSVNNV